LISLKPGHRSISQVAAKVWVWKFSMPLERVLRWALIGIAVAGLAGGIMANAVGRSHLADLSWTLATAPVVAGLGV